MKKAGLYVRVSTLEQKKHGLSVDSQISALTEYCRQNSLEVFQIYNDAGLSARKTYLHRPALLQMIKDCQEGKIDVVLFTKLDRFFRSVPDYYACVGQMADVPWRAIWEDYETETSAGVFKVNIMLSVAQSEADRTSERIKSVNAYRIEKGEYVGCIPFGYKKVNRVMIKDPKKAEGLEKFFEVYCNGGTTKEAVTAAKMHGCLIKRGTAYKILHSELYTGTAQGNTIPAYITAEQFAEIRSRKNTFLRTPIEGNVYLFKGISYCAYCGKLLSASSRKRYSKKKGEYLQFFYQCRNMCSNYITEDHCIGVGINENYLEEEVLNLLESELERYNDQELKKYEIYISDCSGENPEERVKKLEAKLKRIGTRYEDGDISTEEYRSKRDAIKAEIESIEIPAARPEIKKLPDGWRNIYADLDQEGKKEWLHSIIKCIKVSKNRQIEIIPR